MDHFRTYMDGLARPRMKWRTVPITPGSGSPVSVIRLYYRDPIEAIQSLLDRPSLAQFMSYAPRRHWCDKEGGGRVYNEIWTGEWAWNTQVGTSTRARVSSVLMLHRPRYLLVPR
jgi:hypothetical protein